jgi:hypothetical protein
VAAANYMQANNGQRTIDQAFEYTEPRGVTAPVSVVGLHGRAKCSLQQVRAVKTKQREVYSKFNIQDIIINYILY